MVEMTVAHESFVADQRAKSLREREYHEMRLRTKDEAWRIPVPGGWNYVTHDEFVEYKMTGKVPELSGGTMRQLLNEKRFWDPLMDPTPLNVYDL